MVRISLAFSLLFLFKLGLAQNCCSGGVPLSSNIGIVPNSSGNFQAALVGDINYLKTVMRGKKRISDNIRERRTSSILLISSYSISKRLSADITLSWVQQFRKINSLSGPINTEKSSGIGDVAILTKYRFSKPENARFDFFGGLGMKLATGQTGQENEDGIRLSLDMQPGSGAFDKLFWLYFQKDFQEQRIRLLASSLFQLTGTFKEYNLIQEYKVGNSLMSRLGAIKNSTIGSQLFDFALEFLFRKNWIDIVENQPIPNTGGQWLFIKPGLIWSYNENLSINLATEIPIYAEVTGEQLSPSNRVIFQLNFRASKKAIQLSE